MKYMKKLSQRELLIEGFGTNLLKQLARGAGQVATTVAKAISPTAVKVAAAAADKVGSALQNTFASPAEAVKDYFRRPEVKSKYKLHMGLNALSTKKGSNRMSQIVNIKVTEVATNKELTASIEAYRTDKGGISKEEWSIKNFKFSNGEEVVVDDNGSKEDDDNSNSVAPEGVEPVGDDNSSKEDDGNSNSVAPEGVEPVGDDSDTKRAFNLTKRLAVGSGGRNIGVSAVEPLSRDEMEGFDKEFLAKFKQKVNVQKDGRASIDGFRFSKSQVDELFKESKKSQKSLLKHLQSMSS